jgi:hypothetical protein
MNITTHLSILLTKFRMNREPMTIAVSQAQIEAMDDKEAGGYAKFGPTGATVQDYRYSGLKVF